MLEMKDNARRHASVMLRKAPDTGLYDVPFDDAPGPSGFDLHVDSEAIGHRHGSAHKAPSREGRCAKQYMSKRRDAPRPRDLGTEKIGVHAGADSSHISILAAHFPHTAQPIPQFVLSGNRKAVQI